MNSSSLNTFWIRGYGCVSFAGRSKDHFFKSLLEDREFSRQSPAHPAFESHETDQASANDKSSARDSLIRDLEVAARDALEKFGSTTDANRRPGSAPTLGVILASTKGFIDDFIFKADPGEISRDPLMPVLDGFLAKTGLNACEKIAVSNACVSSLTALALAQTWIKSGRATDVLVLAADRVGPFVTKGFQTLKVLTPDVARPFSSTRAGFFLGSAAAAIWLSAARGDSNLKITGTASDTEGSLMTDVEKSSASLKHAIQSLRASAPDVVIAHGTGTVLNDLVEDRVFHELFPDVPVTGTKWAIGHTLAASGAMDLIAACEVLREQKVFPLATTDEIDPNFKSRYVTENSWARAQTQNGARPIRRVLVSSLGFGGVHGALQIERVTEDPKNVDGAAAGVPATNATEITMKTFEHRFVFPAKQEPAWGPKVDRWYQLDAAAFGVADAYANLQNQLKENPDYLVLASPEASNRTDHLFTRTGATSPSKFVHTLPNVRSAALLAVAGLHLPCLCVQADPETEAAGLREAKTLLETDPRLKRIWVASVFADHRVRLSVLTKSDERRITL